MAHNGVGTLSREIYAQSREEKKSSSPLATPWAAPRSFGKDIVLVPTGIGWIGLNLVAPSQPLFDFVVRIDELLKIRERNLRYIAALWFARYDEWEKTQPKRKKRDVVSASLKEAMVAGFRVQGLGFRGSFGGDFLRPQGSRNNEQWSVTSDQWPVASGQENITRTTSDEVRGTSSAVGAVVQVSSSPVVDPSDPVWQDYLASRINRAEFSTSGFISK